MSQQSIFLEPLLRYLKLRDRLAADEVEALEKLPLRLATFQRGDELIKQFSRPTESCLIVEGFAARVVNMQDGKRAITSLHISGDFVDLHAMLMRDIDHSVIAMSRCRAAFIPQSAIRQLVADFPHLGRLLWMSTTIDGATQRAWIAGRGRRGSVKNLAFLICEIYTRLKAVGIASNERMILPLTQTELSDILGLSQVHVNRALQELRRTGWITWIRNEVTITDGKALADFADFDPTYLSLNVTPR